MNRVLLGSWSAALFVVTVTAGPAPAQITYNWTGGAFPDGSWSAAANWGGTAPLSDIDNTILRFDGTTNTTTVVDAGLPTSGTPPAFEAFQLTFAATAGAFNITQGTGGPILRMGGGGGGIVVAVGNTNNQSIDVPISVSGTGGHGWANNGTGLLTVSGAVTLSGVAFTIGGSGNTLVSGAIGSTGAFNGLSYSGSGTLTLSGANTYSGLTIINGSGTLRLAGGADRLPTGTTIQFNLAGVVDLNGQNQQVAGLTTFVGSAARVVNTAGGPATTFTVAPASSQTYAGRFGGTGGDNLNLVFTPAVGTTYTLTGAHTYTGTTTITRGTVALTGSGSFANSNTITVGPVPASGAVLNATGLTGGANHDGVNNGRLALATGQTLQGLGGVSGGVTVQAGSTVQGGVGSTVGTLTVTGPTTINADTVAGGTLRVWVRDNAGTVTNSQLAVAGAGNDLDFVNVTTGTSRFRIDLRDAGGLQLGTPYTITLATADTIRRNGVAVSSTSGGGSFTFDPGDYVLSSPGIAAFDSVSLQAVGGSLQLSFTPVSEPVGLLALAAGGLALARSRQRAGKIFLRPC